MRQHLEFLETSSAVVKFAAWIFLVLGLVSGINAVYIITTKVSNQPVGKSILAMVVFTFLFFFFYLIAKIADLLVQIINEIKKE